MNNKEYVVRVKLSNGTFADLPFQAISPGQVIAIVETLYGKGSFLGIIKSS
jgi:hypothetical protein